MKIFRFIALLLLSAAMPLHAQIRLPKLISDHMVLQRDEPLKIWGWASPKERISLRFDQKTYKTSADAAGKWELVLPPHAAGTAYTMVLKGRNEIRISDIAFGDVWLCSGQSNMVINMERVKERFPADIASANYPEIRNFFVPTLTNLNGPADDFPNGEWKTAIPENILSFGAVAYFFAREIYEKHKVPIGIINSSVGGTPIEAWISEGGFRDFEDIRKTIIQNKDTSYVHALARNAGVNAQEHVADAGRKERWESDAYQPKGWRNFNIPGYWEDQGLKALDGVVWFRKTIEVPQHWAGKAVKLYMGRIVDADEMYVNGQKIGHITYQYPPRRYEIPAGVLKAGRNSFVIRVTNTSGKGGFVPDKPYFMTTGADTVDLKGTWQYKVGAVFPTAQGSGSPRLIPQSQPTALYNAMVAPVLPLKIKGFVWYQGESNTGDPEPYNALLPALIRDWRSRWHDDRLPFLVAQLPNFQDIDYTPAESDIALLREAQNKALTLPNTAVTVTIDLGEWNDIHPLNKKDIGKRLSLAARNLAYGEEGIAYSGPVLKSQSIENDQVILTFDHVGDGITASDNEPLRWFALADEDRKFYWAEAEILGKDRIALRSGQVKSPRYVRYAWQDNPAGVNFYNSAGLPASPFRTDGPDSKETTNASADDGYRLWLKYEPIQSAVVRSAYSQAFRFIAAPGNSDIVNNAARELQTALNAMLGKQIPIVKTPVSSQSGIILSVSNRAAPGEGYSIQMQAGNTLVTASQDAGVLYGSFALLRHLQQHLPLEKAAMQSSPRIQLRMLNHWDNPEGTIERGYAGSSLWKWYELPETVDPRYTDYARANASIGINGTVVNNVNASARFLTAEYLHKVAALAGVFRKYGIKTYLSIHFAAPKTLGGLKTSDPLDPEVRKWWTEKVKEIYGIIPDFGGFLVKANSEGEPGPQDYGRTHADGANMLAEALAPFDGVVIWRAFVYKADPKADRFKAAYEEFAGLDGKFARNVIVQVKNGPIDFQPREPFSPLFGNMPRTPLGMEFQLTQEYLGFATHWVYEAPIFKECLDADTYVKGKGSTVASVVDGSLHNYPLTCIAGVANTGSDRNWTGHPMAQANWYAFGRMAWDHTLGPEAIAREWTQLTLTHDPKHVATIGDIMLRSRDIYVDYNTPLGLSRPWTGNHYAPEPWQNRSSRPDWTAIYYHRADSLGLGFDRTATGSQALEEYRPEVRRTWENAETCPLPYLLWFHHIPWSKKLSSGRNLWDELCHRFYTGADSVLWMQKQWASVQTAVNPAIHADVTGRLAKQYKEALWWRDAWVLYLQTFSKRPVPGIYPKPERTLEEVKKSVNVYLMR